MVAPVPPNAALPPLSERVIDVINPLQHIPCVSFLYRGITGDQITPDAQFAGGFLFGGPLGALGAAASMIVAGAFGEVLPETGNAWSSKSVDDAPDIKFTDPWKFNA